ncbi:MAG TPA: lectin-like protein [Polyangiaceae bacterium]|nr:lectin-like protein [Polyangiaceae bacterium]
MTSIKRLAQGLTLGLLAMACGSQSRDESVGAARQALTAAQQRVLGFETPLTDWSGGAIASSAIRSEGAAALALSPKGYTELTSAKLSSLGLVKSSFSFDLRLPQTVSWGEARVILRLPSKGISWQDLGGRSLVGLPAGSYQKLTFAIPANVETTLEGTYSDLDIKIVLNAPSGGAPYLFDHIDLADTGTPMPVPAPGLTLTYPKGAPLSSVFMSASDALQIDDRVTLAQSGQLPEVAGLGSGGVELGAGTQAFANIKSGGSAYLRASSHVYGSLRAVGDVTFQQTDVKVDGGSTKFTVVDKATTTLDVDFPSTTLGPKAAGPDGPVLPIDPGAYSTLDVRSRGKVQLRAGTYYFDTLNTEPDAEIQLAGAPIYLYVKSSFTFKGGFKRLSGEDGQILVGYLGTTTAYVEAAFVGTLVAPNATLELRRPGSGQHKGTFFGKKIEAFSDSAIAFLPFNFSVACTLGDTDQDGTSDCDDYCNKDKLKTSAGQCGCGVADLDTDLDGVMNCKDGCPNDASSQAPGVCGCPSAPVPDGTPCADSICPGQHVCHAGQCGDASECAPEPGCVAKFFDQHWYFICPGPKTYDAALTACQSIGSTLAHIDEQEEDDFLSRNLKSSAAFIGANDRTTEGEWRWATPSSDRGDRFWTGGSSGRRYFARYSAWASGSPIESGEDCATLGSGGKWANTACSTAAGFVCEVSAHRGEGPFKKPPRFCEIMGLHCPDENGSSVHDKCDTSEATVWGSLSKEQTATLFATCNSKCQQFGQDSQECKDACTGPASIPPLGQGCDDFTDAEVGTCTLKSHLEPLVGCETDANCPTGSVCGVFYDCPLADRDQKISECVALNADRNARGSGKVCGTPVDGCAQKGATAHSDRCAEAKLCEVQETQATTTVQAPGSDLSKTDFDPENEFDAPVAAPDTPFPQLSEPSCAPNCPTDPRAAEKHPWCTMGTQDQIGAAQENKPEKKGKSDSDSDLVSFEFNPHLRMLHDAKLGALGIPELQLVAEAGFDAKVHYEIAGGGDIPVLDVLAGLHADVCGAESVTTLDILGIDFVPILEKMTQSDWDLPLTIPAEQAQKDCAAGLSKVRDYANRAKKAYLDAVTLIKQYNALVADDDPAIPATIRNNFSKNLCSDLLQQKPRGFPAIDCATATPEAVLNAFITYYERTVLGFLGQDGALGLKDAVNQLSDLAYGKDFTLYNWQKNEEVTIAQFQFFVGPVPVNLEILSTTDFGVNVNAHVELSAQPIVSSIFRMGGSQPSQSLAKVTADGEPHAGVELGVFCGVGFSFAGVGARIGLEADLHLGEVHVPVYAGAGIGLGAEVDTRAPPADLVDVVTEDVLVPTKRYFVDVFYEAGLEARVRNILNGHIDAKVKVEFFFFSKTWRKTLFQFDGICKGDANTPNKNCDFPLVSLANSTTAAEGRFPWAEIRPELAFSRLRKITSSATPGNRTASVEKAGKLFYDSLCQCIDGDDPNDQRECFRSDDCCPGSKPRCLKPANGGKPVCTLCQDVGRDCNADADCCDPTNNVCINNKCSGKLFCNATCSRDVECASKHCEDSSCKCVVQ